MRKLDSYIARHVLAAMALVLLVLGGLDFLFTIVDELGNTNERYSSLSAINYVLLTFPRHIYELLPMSALIGSLVGLGLLASGNELLVMQASGVSVLRIVFSVVKPALLVLVFGVLLGEYLAPKLELRAELNKSTANGVDIGLSRYGHWEKDGDAFLHFNSIEARGVLNGVSLLVFDEQQRVVHSVEAERAVYVADSNQEQVTDQAQSGIVQRERFATLAGQSVDSQQKGNAFWLLENGKENTFSYSNADRVEGAQRSFTAQNWELDVTPELLQVLIVDADVMAMSDLYTYAQRFERQGQDAAPYFLSFWKKVFQPLTTLVLVLVAVSFIFGPLRQATMGSRLVTAICFGMAFTILQRLTHNVSLVYQISPLLAVIVPLLVTAILGLLMFRRAA